VKFSHLIDDRIDGLTQKTDRNARDCEKEETVDAMCKVSLEPEL